MNCVIYSLYQFSSLHTFFKPNNIKTKPKDLDENLEVIKETLTFQHTE